MGTPWFHFKQFSVEQHQSALKVGTDGVLLGAWCAVAGARRILDVGTGTGLIALMLAQRSQAEIDAVEISEAACEDAQKNFRQSPWASRLRLFPGDFNHFRAPSPDYDLVVSNPPFFEKSLRSADYASSAARHDLHLSFVQLIAGARRVLAEAGRLAVIIPVGAFDSFKEEARLEGFFLARKTVVVPKTGKKPKRVLLEFSLSRVYPAENELVILDGLRYSDDFIGLTKDFYLKFA